MGAAYIVRLMGLGDRKSVQPMAARNVNASYNRLHDFVGSSVWYEAPLEAALLAEIGRQVGTDLPG